MPYRQTIAAAYNAGVTEEYNRLIKTPLREAEFKLIIDLIDEYIHKEATVIDIGSGPGRYAEYLLNKNCNVGVIDLSAKSLKAFSDRIKGFTVKGKIIYNKVSCATQLNWITEKSADAILLMGPLYHLINEEHRAIALNHCSRILKPGGYIFSVFLSPFPLLIELGETNTSSYLETNSEPYKNVKSELTTYTHFKGFKVPQYRCWPKEAEKLMSSHGFHTVRIRNIEGTASFFNDQKINSYSGHSKKRMLFQQLKSTSEDKKLLGITHQYIHVGQLKTMS